MSWINRLKKLALYFWGTHDNKYVVDHEGRKIIFFDNRFSNIKKNITTWSNRNKL